MSLRNPKREEIRRLESKTLDAQFKTAVQDGLNCSPFEAEAVLGVVREVYCPFRDASTPPPWFPQTPEELVHPSQSLAY